MNNNVDHVVVIQVHQIVMKRKDLDEKVDDQQKIPNQIHLHQIHLKIKENQHEKLK